MEVPETDQEQSGLQPTIKHLRERILIVLIINLESCKPELLTLSLLEKFEEQFLRSKTCLLLNQSIAVYTLSNSCPPRTKHAMPFCRICGTQCTPVAMAMNHPVLSSRQFREPWKVSVALIQKIHSSSSAMMSSRLNSSASSSTPSPPSHGTLDTTSGKSPCKGWTCAKPCAT